MNGPFRTENTGPAMPRLWPILRGQVDVSLHYEPIHNLSASFIHVGWACDDAMWVPK